MKFTSFVVFAEMRTGSNHLEESINAFGDLKSYGEVFNPVFMGHHNLTDLFGHTMEMRANDPLPLLRLMRENTDGLSGFRFFYDHDPRVIETILNDRQCAKVILTRNPVDSFVSLEIARATGQWRLMNEKKRKTEKITFDPKEFDLMVERTGAFQTRIQKALRTTGQAAYHLRYEDINDLDVINGLGAFLGSQHRLDALPGRLKRQNPGGLRDKVANFEQMEAHLGARGGMASAEAATFEPERTAAVPTYLAGASAPVLFMPITGGPVDEVTQWLRALDGSPPQTGFSQKTLRPWMRKSAPFTSFTVVRHPLERAYHVFNTLILPRDVDGYEEVRKSLINHQGVPIPKQGPVQGYGLDEHRTAFAAFLAFIKRNLNGATGLRTDAAWASQVQTVQGFSQMMPPHRVIREDRLDAELSEIAARLGLDSPAMPVVSEAPFPLAQVHSRDLEDACMDAYRRDYMSFGFKRWDRMQKGRP